ncbi:MAG: DEAD/DEAH box helicase family protein [Alphaproteobacteria bacterium]|nr:DEAD/DEAH box helicase family protein [Alphaproteobacteria bacterium]
MSLSALSLKPVYRTGRDDLVKDFYIPCLKASVKYDRAVGFFSASMLSLAAQGLSALVERQGTMRLIVGGALTEDEAKAVMRGYTERAKADAEERIHHEVQTLIKDISDSLFECRLHALSNLIAFGRLDIKVALTRKGMYHEKIGIFYDEGGNSVVFAGSANESQSALSPDFNFESVSVYPSWSEAVRDYHDEFAGGFLSLWDNNENRAIVIDFPTAAKEDLIKFATTRAGMVTPDLELAIWDEMRRKYASKEECKPSSSLPCLPKVYKGIEFDIRRHQRKALQKWQAADYFGILALATGAGKTVTAIYAATKMLTAKGRLALVVAVPYQSLAEQWIEEMSLFGWRAIPCFGGWQNWFEKAGELSMSFQSGGIQALSFVVVNATLTSDKFQDILKRLPVGDLMWVGDECHHHGSERVASSIPKEARYRLGLSATPFDYMSESRNERVRDSYGSVVSTYGLREALEDSVLTPYDYHVHVVELTDKETLSYIEISNKIRNLMLSGADAEENQALTAALMLRARILGSAYNKIGLLRDLLADRGVEPMTLFYCGDGSVEDEDDNESMRQIDAVSLLVREYGWRTSHFTAHESRKERQAILDNFRHGIIDGLVAIRCLDEGVDVPSCRTAYIIASSRNPRQFIQRRGRILRRSPGKDFAVIHDFLVRVPKMGDDSYSLERSLVSAELKRVAEFAGLAQNFSQVFEKVKPLLAEYDLLHELIAGSLQHLD